jgi:hypothetical protein
MFVKAHNRFLKRGGYEWKPEETGDMVSRLAKISFFG